MMRARHCLSAGRSHYILIRYHFLHAKFNIPLGVSTSLIFPYRESSHLVYPLTPPLALALVHSGFIRLALRHGVPVVPVLAIGEKYMYTRVRIPR